MGISRSKAGNVVDCPSCGRSVRVPELDGSVKPLPAVGLNLQDSSLKKALNQIAVPNEVELPDAQEALKGVEAELRQLQVPPGKSTGEERNDNGFASEDVLEPGVSAENDVIELPIPELKPPIELSTAKPTVASIPVAAPEAAVKPLAAETVAPDTSSMFDDRIDQSEPADGDLQNTADGDIQNSFVGNVQNSVISSYETVESGDEPMDDPTAPMSPDCLLAVPLPATVPIHPTVVNSDIAPGELDQELEKLAAMAPARDPRVAPGPGTTSTPQSQSPLIYVLAIVMLVVGFALGQVRSGNSVADGPGGPPTETTTTVVAPSDKGDAEMPAQGLFGRVTYRTALGDSFPDNGARVIVLPRRANIERPLQINGLRPADDADAFSTVLKTVRQAGGESVTVGDNGSFQCQVPETGTYHVLILSRFHRRSDEVQIASELKQALDDYFAESDRRKLLGQWGYAYGRVKIDGNRSVPWDHVFQ